MSQPEASSPEQAGALRGFFALVVARPVAVVMLHLGAAVFGFVSYAQLPLNLMPDLSYPSLTVRTEFTGAAPEEVEAQVSRPVEEALSTTEGLVALESRSRAELSDVVLEFQWATDMDQAAQSVRERLQQTWLPQEAGRPLLLRYDPSLDPILRVALSAAPGAEGAPQGQAALVRLRDVAERLIKPKLEAMEGVAAVRVRGGLEREVLVEVREEWLSARRVTLDDVTQALTAENVNVAGGSILEGDTEYLIRTLNEFATLDEIRRLQVRRSTDGLSVPLADVAVVSEAYKEREVISRLDGHDAVELEVFKEADANIVAVAAAVKSEVAEGGAGGPGGGRTLRSELPPWVALALLDDQAAFIEAALGNLRSTAVQGGIFAVLVLFLFLRDFRSTAIIAAAIPLSVVVTFATLYVGKVSLNLMSLGGLALGVGMLVDNAVVVLEAIQVYRERGVARLEAAVLGVREVAGAVVASTMTTVAVFLPIAFVDGIAGQLFRDLALTVVFSLLASLVVAMVFVPMLAAREAGPLPDRARLDQLVTGLRFGSIGAFVHAVRSNRGRGWLWLPYQALRFALHLGLDLAQLVVVLPLAFGLRLALWMRELVVPRLGGVALWVAERFEAAWQPAATRYPGWIRAALRRPGLVLGAAALSVVVAWVVGAGLGSELIPEVHQGRFVVRVALPVGTPLPATALAVRDVEEMLAANPDVASVYAAIGSERRADSSADEGEHTARLLVQLRPEGRVAEQQERVMGEVRAALQALGGDLAVTVAAPALFSFRTPVEVIVFGDDLEALRRVSEEAGGVLGEVPGVRDVQSSLVAGYPEVRVVYDRALVDRFGLSTASIARALRDKVQGAQATRVRRGEVKVDLVARLAASDRSNLADLGDINVNPRLVPPIPLVAVASLESGTGPSEIRRIDQQRAAVLSANLEGFDLGTTANAIARGLSAVQLPEGVTVEVAGQSQEMERSSRSLVLALGLAIFLVYAIMAATFESLLHPFVILFSLPLAAVGVVGVLALTGTALSVVVLIGVIVLAGVVVNNAIVLVDTVNRLRGDGLAVADALAEAGRLRLRPILITTATTVLGLLPLALGFGEGAEIQQPLALTLIAGLTSSTLLTLLVIPVAYERVGALVRLAVSRAPRIPGVSP